MVYLYAFLFCGLVCAIGEFIYDTTKLTPGHIVVMLVGVGGILEVFDVYKHIQKYCGGGASLPITSFGSLLVRSSYENAVNTGSWLGIFTGVYTHIAGGIGVALTLAFIAALIFRSKS